MDVLWDFLTGSLMLIVYLALGGVALLVLFWVVVAAVVIMKSLWKRLHKRRAAARFEE